MSKKSYKRLQNRLYREIKRRIEAEKLSNRVCFPSKTVNVETLTCRQVIPEKMRVALPTEYIKSEMARRLSVQLLAQNLIRFTERTEMYDSINMQMTEISAYLKVLRPETVSEEEAERTGR